MTSRTEVSIDEGVGRQEALCLLRRLEPLRLPLSAPRWSMRVFSPVVQIAALSVLDIRQKLALRHAIAPQFVGNDDTRCILQARR
jgi:hypothetical protein